MTHSNFHEPRQSLWLKSLIFQIAFLTIAGFFLWTESSSNFLIYLVIAIIAGIGLGLFLGKIDEKNSAGENNSKFGK
ncbi:MAG: hypothetical protein L3J32_03345 [Rhizobiaceae bacterium]|nr:hypothetical protein [Rhizobiaceae bacterium]